MKLFNCSLKSALAALILLPCTGLSLKADEVVSTNKASDWAYEARVPKSGNSVEKAKPDMGKEGGLRFNYSIGGAVGSDVFTMYLYKNDAPIEFSQVPSEVELSVLGNESNVAIYMHFVDAKNVSHIYIIPKPIDWKGWEEIKLPWSDLEHAAWGDIPEADAQNGGRDVEVSPPLRFRGITIQCTPEEGQTESGSIQIKDFKFKD